MLKSTSNLLFAGYRFFLIAVFLVYFSASLTGNAQGVVDSLRALLKNNPPDSLKVDIYLSLNSAVRDTIGTYLSEAISLSEKIGDRKRLARCYLRLARENDIKGDLYGAREALATVKQQFKYFHDAKIEATFYYQVGIIDYFEAAYDEAVENFWKTLRLYEELGESSSVAACYLNIGNCYKELDNLDKTLEYYLKSLSIYETKGNEDGAAMAYGNIGNVYRAKHDYDRALDYFNKSLRVNRKNNNHEDIRIDLNNIGNVFLDKAEYGTALSFFKESLDMSHTIGSERGVLISNFNIGLVELKSHHYNKALNKFNEVLTMAKARNFKEDVKDTYEILSKTYEDMGQYQHALEYRKEFELWKDSLISESHLNQVKEQELKYETEKKDQQIQLLAKESEIREKESQRQATLKRAFIGGFVLVSLLAILIANTFRQRLKNQKTLAAKNEEIHEIDFKRQLSELEMKALRAQINPHFLFNCMNSINRMILNGETENASIYLTKFSKLVRLILENGETTNVSLENELTLLESYIQLEELRFKGKIGYNISVDESIEKESTYLPSMVLQPFVENAIWHGLMHKGKDEKGIINIKIREEDDRLLCIIEDNGVGREKAQELREKSVLKSKSMGMKITEDRLRLLSRKGLEELIHITDLKDALNHALGTRVEINIPIT